MANYFYVKSGGSLGVNDDTSFSSEQADSFANIGAANYYDSIAAAVSDGTKTSPASDGDFVLVSNVHTKPHDFGSSPQFNTSGAVAGLGLNVTSVDDTDTSVYLPGADEYLNDGSDDWVLKFNTFIAGITLQSDDECIVAQLLDTAHHLSDVTLPVSNGIGDTAMRMGVNTGNKVVFTNVDISTASANNDIIILTEGIFIWNGGVLSGTSASEFFKSVGSSGLCYVLLNGVDLSGFTGQILNDIAATVSPVFVRLTDCEINSSATLYGTLARQSHRFELYNTDIAAGVQHRFEIADGTGVAVNNDSVYVTATESWYGGTDKSSIAVTTTAICSRCTPFIFELPAQYVDLGVSDVITLDMVTATTLTAGDICVFLVYPDGTTKTQPNWVSSTNAGSGNYGHDPMTTAAIPSTSPAPLAAGDWTGEPGSPLFYRLNMDTTIDAGAATAISVRIEVYKASITSPIYIHPLVRLT